MSGPIPPELGGLEHLQHLYLGLTQLSGPIPPELGGLEQLQRLDLRENQLSGPIPPELGGLARLQWLDLGFNPDLAGAIPQDLQQSPLASLDLMATSVCVPEDAELHEWLAAIEFSTSGLVCGRPPDAMSEIDIMVVYTPAARRLSGGTAEIEAEIDLMIAETNQAYLEGGVNQSLFLVAREEVEYVESGNRDFYRLISASDGYMDEVHAIRDRSGADLVYLIVDGHGGAQLAGAFAYSGTWGGSLVFAHELGHNMGVSHDRYVESYALFPYGYGYVNQRAFADGAPETARWNTIMAYPNQCYDAGFSCDWIMRFSNPDQTYLGDPLGVPGEERTRAVDGPSDAVRALNIMRHSVAAFRPRAAENQLRLSSTAPQARSMAGASQAAVPVPGGSLFRAVSPTVGGGAAWQRSGSVLDRATLRRREAGVDFQSLAGVVEREREALRLNLFDDLVLTGIIERRTPTYSGGHALSGRLAGIPGGRVTLVVNGSVVAGTVRLPGAIYRIRPAGGGSHAILQVDPSLLPWECEVVGRTTGVEQ